MSNNTQPLKLKDRISVYKEIGYKVLVVKGLDNVVVMVKKSERGKYIYQIIDNKTAETRMIVSENPKLSKQEIEDMTTKKKSAVQDVKKSGKKVTVGKTTKADPKKATKKPVRKKGTGEPTEAMARQRNRRAAYPKVSEKDMDRNITLGKKKYNKKGTKVATMLSVFGSKTSMKMSDFIKEAAKKLNTSESFVRTYSGGLLYKEIIQYK